MKNSFAPADFAASDSREAGATSRVQTGKTVGFSPWDLYAEIAAGTVRGLSINQTCRTLGISRSKLYSEIAAGKIKVKKCGKKTLVVASSVEAYWDALPEGTSKGA